MIVFFTSVSVGLSTRIKIWEMVVEKQKTLCGGRKTDNLIEHTCFYLKISQVHVFYSNFS